MLFGNIKKGLEEWERTPGAMLIDVRERDEYAEGHIPGAVNFPLSEIAAADGRWTGERCLQEDAPLFLYCLRGSRAAKAARLLRGMGYAGAKAIGGIKSYRGEVER